MDNLVFTLGSCVCLIRTHPTVSVFCAFLFVKCDMLCVMVFFNYNTKETFLIKKKKAFLLTHCKKTINMHGLTFAFQLTWLVFY